jgi:hypothetical protein
MLHLSSTCNCPRCLQVPQGMRTSISPEVETSAHLHDLAEKHAPISYMTRCECLTTGASCALYWGYASAGMCFSALVRTVDSKSILMPQSHVKKVD